MTTQIRTSKKNFVELAEAMGLTAWHKEQYDATRNCYVKDKSGNIHAFATYTSAVEFMLLECYEH